MTPLEIEALFKAGADDNVSEAHRVQMLHPVLATAQHLWFTGDPTIDVVAEKLGDGSRDPTWRVPLGLSAILDFFLGILEVSGIRPALKMHTLRLIGNACADTDTNRDRIVASGHLPAVVRLVDDDEVLSFVVPVLYNICVDYEPAQDAAFDAGIAKTLYNLISGPRHVNCAAIIGLVAQVLTFFAAKDPNPNLVDPMTPVRLLQYAAGGPLPGADLDRFVTLTSAALAYLTHPPNQAVFLCINGLPTLLAVFQSAVTIWMPPAGSDPDLIARHKSIQMAFLNVVSDLTGLDDAFSFSASPEIQNTLLSFLSSQSPDLQTLACLALGNMARNDTTAVEFVSNHRIHHLATSILIDPSNGPNTTLLHAALGLLKNLSIPSRNKAPMGPVLLGSPTAPLPRLWVVDTLPQVQFQAVSLTRSLAAGCAANVRLLLTPLSPDPSSPASQSSKLSVIQHLCTRTDSEPCRIECARLVLAVCRALHSRPVSDGDQDWISPSELTLLAEKAHLPTDRISTTNSGLISETTTVVASSPEAIPPSENSNHNKEEGTIPAADAAAATPTTPVATERELFYQRHADIGKALSILVRQTQWPALASECWFVFSLMARSVEGARAIMEIVMTPEGTASLHDALTGKTKQKGSGGGGGGVQPALGPSQSDMVPAGLLSGAGEGTTATATAAAGTEPSPEEIKRRENMIRVDRENAMVLVSELLRNCPEMPSMRRSGMAMLLKEAAVGY